MYFIIYTGKGRCLQADGDSHGKQEVQVAVVHLLPTAGSWIIQL